MRCMTCGTGNPDEDTICRMCGGNLVRYRAVPRTEDPLMPYDAQAGSPSIGQRFPIQPGAESPMVARHGLTRVGFPARSPRRSLFAPEPRLTGAVLFVERQQPQPADFNWPRFVNRMLLLLELIGMPLVLLWIVLHMGPLSIILAIAAVFFLFKFVSPHGILSSLRVFRYINPFQQGEQVPTTYFRIRDGMDREIICHIKGALDGHIMGGDQVAIWGDSRRGIVRVRRGVNLRTGASLTLPRNSSWLFLAIHMVVLSTLLVIFYRPIKQVLEFLS